MERMLGTGSEPKDGDYIYCWKCREWSVVEGMEQRKVTDSEQAEASDMLMIGLLEQSIQ
jgi:hypothetical protein